jgi:hypothetical protein
MTQTLYAHRNKRKKNQFKLKMFFRIIVLKQTNDNLFPTCVQDGLWMVGEAGKGWLERLVRVNVDCHLTSDMNMGVFVVLPTKLYQLIN